MKFRRKVTVLASIASALLLTFVLGEIFSPARLSKSASEARLFPGFAAKEAKRIEFTGAESKLSLLENGNWIVAVGNSRYPAAESKVNFLLQELALLRVGKLVTRKAEAASTFGFGSAEEIHLAVYGDRDEKLCELFSGKAGPVGRGKYIRVGNDAGVYETGDSLSPYLSADARFWENLKVFPLDVKTEEMIGLKVEGKLSLSEGKDVRSLSYELARSTDQNGTETWNFLGRGGSAPDAKKVKNALDALVAFEGNGIEAAPATMPKRAVAVTLTLADSRKLVLYIGARLEGDQYPCALENGGYSYTVPEWRISQALVTRESLAPQSR
jgi:hypothetical protein